MEVEGKGKLLCMLCCVPYSKHDKIKKLNSLTTLLRFKKFCTELECVLAEKHLPKCLMTKARLKGQLNLAYGDLSICPQCMTLICSAVDMKETAKNLEEQVRSLQSQLLEVMEDLNGKMGTFLTRMKKLEDVVKSSDAERLQRYIEKNVAKELRGDAGEFRDRILYAVTDLRLYRQELTDKVACDNLVQRREQERLLKRSNNLVDKNTQTKIRGEKEFNAVTAVHRPKVRNVKLQTDLIQVPSTQEPPMPVVKVEVNPEDILMAEGEDGNDGFLDDHDNYHSNDEVEQNESVEKKNLPKPSVDVDVSSPRSSSRLRPRRSVALKRKLPSPSLSSSNESSDNEEDADDDGGSEHGSNFSDDDYDMLKMKQEKDVKEGRKLFDNLDLSQMSDFKIRVVSLVLKKWEDRMDMQEKSDKQSQSEETGEDVDFKNLLKSVEEPWNKYLIEYNPEAGTFSMENIAIIFNEEEKSLQCSACSYAAVDRTVTKSKNLNSVAARMQNHILGKHLNAYQCPICSSVFSNSQRYKNHVKSHNEPICCDICGKPFRSKHSLPNHKWLHMNEAEKWNAVQRGVPNPEEMYRKSKSKPKTLPCSTCGKMFRNKSEVRLHEKIHGERDRIPCEKCGKLILNETSCISSHLAYTCSGVDHKMEERQCHICHKVYKNIKILKRHMVLDHSSEPLTLVTCEVCGRQFKTKSSLQLHRKVHSEEKPFSCTGCGMGFKRRDNCRRHESTCSQAREGIEGSNEASGSSRKKSRNQDQQQLVVEQKPGLDSGEDAAVPLFQQYLGGPHFS